ncbi:MAG: cytochrome c [Phycisphaeraceae bacterium]|nr:MAG: cytochrome c [Phycisphaeraceae bacterium]
MIVPAARTVIMLALAMCIAVPLTGCRDDRTTKRQREFFPDMDNQPKVLPQSNVAFYITGAEDDGDRSAPLFIDGRSARLPVRGTVPFGRTTHVEPVRSIDPDDSRTVDFSQRHELLRDDDAWARGRTPRLNARGEYILDDNGSIQYEWVERMPVAVTRELLELGQQKYDIYCLPCHGGTGQSDGLVGVRWAYPPTRLTEERLYHGGENGQDGWLFHVIRNGVVNPGGDWELQMPAYGRKLTIEESWAIVAYVRALQLRLQGTPDMLPDRERLELDRRRSAVAPTQDIGRTAHREDAL